MEPKPTRARYDGPLGTDRFIEEGLFSPIYWPWKVVRLERDSLQDFRHRSFSASMSVSELYHENSKLFPEMLPELTAARVTDELREELVRRRSASIGTGPSDGIGAWGEFVSRTTQAIDPGIF